MSDDRQIVVAQLSNSDLRPYRIPLLQRLSTRSDIDLTLYYGQAPPGFGAPAAPPAHVPVNVRPIVNRFWPGRGHRVAWQSGALFMLRSDASVLVLPEIIHNLTVWVIRATHRLFRKRLVLIGFFARPEATSWHGRLQRRLLLLLRRSASSVISYTETGLRQLLADGWSADRVFVSYNTLDTEMLEHMAAAVTPEQVAVLREHLAIGERPVLLFVGKLIPEKRVDVAIEAVARLADPPVLIVVGDGPQMERLEEIADPRDVRFVGQIYDESELARYFAIATVMLLPGRVGLTCVHGFANGVPCLTTANGPVSQTPEFEYVADGYNGVVVPQPDPAQYAQAIESLLADPGQIDRLRQGAMDTSRRLRMDAMVDAFVEAIKRAAR